MIACNLRAYADEFAATKRQINAIVRATFEEMGVYWHRSIRPKHFTKAGYYEYEYAPRGKKYNARKRRKYGHDKPLVYTGTSEMRSRIRNVAPTPKGVRVKINAPTLNRRPHMRRELLAASSRDEAVLYGLAEKLLRKKMRDAGINKRNT